MRPRYSFSTTRPSPEGKLAFEVGVKVGYWPCLKGPFVSLCVGRRRLDLWIGLPSYWPKDGTAPKEDYYHAPCPHCAKTDCADPAHAARIVE